MLLLFEHLALVQLMERQELHGGPPVHFLQLSTPAAWPSCPTLESGQRFHLSQTYDTTNWVPEIIYLPAEPGCSQSLKNQLASLPVPLSQPEGHPQYRKHTFSQDFTP